MILKMTKLFWSEGYCYFLDFLYIAYYSITNCVTGRINGPNFSETNRQFIFSSGNNEAREITGVFVSQVQRLYYQSHIPDSISYRNRYQLTGEHVFFFVAWFSTVLVILNLN